MSYDKNVTERLRIKVETYYQRINDVPVDGNNPSYFSLLNEGANFGFGTPDTLSADGTGTNFGLELTLEQFLNKGLYYLFTASLFDSKYKGSDGVERNTAFNGGYVLNGLVGKEWTLKMGKAREGSPSLTLGFDLKTTLSGGQRYTPSSIIQTGESQYDLNYDWDKAFSNQFAEYSRTDLKFSFKINGKRITQEWAIDIQNVFDQDNVYSQSLNKKTGERYYTYQTGRMIIPQYRIIF